MQIDEYRLTLAVIYGPNKDDPTFFENLQKSTYLLNCFKPSLGIITLVYSFTF